jgi:hypothetical protein
MRPRGLGFLYQRFSSLFVDEDFTKTYIYKCLRHVRYSRFAVDDKAQHRRTEGSTIGCVTDVRLVVEERDKGGQF